MRRILDEQKIGNFKDVLQMFDQNWSKPKTISEASNYIDQSGEPCNKDYSQKILMSLMSYIVH